jgi:C1A family cysteine protease
MSIEVLVDLRDQFGDVRNQGERPTCMAFAVSDAHSFARGNTSPLSVEYAYFHAVRKRANTDRTTGVSFDAMSEAIANDGQPLESGWPYLTKLAAGDAWTPPKELGVLFHRAASKLSGGIADIVASLDAGRPVVMVMNISISFFNAAPNQVLPALIGEPRVNTHAVIAVGRGEITSGPCLLVRNSWGTSWGDGGYAWIHEDYLKPRFLAAGTLN